MTATSPQATEIYKHYKRGSLYRVLCVAMREADLVSCVVYESLDPEAEHRFWIRTVEDFCEEVLLEDGTRRPRFSRQEKTPSS